MPLCDGLPDRPCPKRVNNRTVKLSQGDLMLCPSCDAERFPPDTKRLNRTPLASVSTTVAKKRVTNARTVNTKSRNKDTPADLNASADDDCCPSCLGNIASVDECVKCDTCKHSFHQGCTGMTYDTFRILLTIVDESFWVCQQCRSESSNIRSAISKTNEELADMRASIVNLSREIDILKNGACTNNAPSYVPPPQSPSTGKSQNLLQKRSDITDVVHRTIKDMARRKCNVIISGLPEPAYHSEEDNKHADESAFFKLCEENLSVKRAITSRGCKRLGRYDGHRPRRLLVHLTSEASATSLLAMAKDLRQSTEHRVAENVFINPDLTPEEAKAAYERRQRRRATIGIRRQLSHVPPADAATGVLNSCMTFPIVTDTVYNTCSTDKVAARSSDAASTAATATSSSSASTGIDMSTGATNQPFRLDK